MFSRLPHSSGRSRSVGRAGLSRRQRRATEVDKEENKAAAPLLSRSTGARACQLQTRGRREIGHGRRERGGLPRKEVDGNCSRRGQQRRSALGLSFSLCRLLAALLQRAA